MTIVLSFSGFKRERGREREREGERGEGEGWRGRERGGRGRDRERERERDPVDDTYRRSCDGDLWRYRTRVEACLLTSAI